MNLFNVYPLYDISIVRGRGCRVWDDRGQEYLDLYGGHAVISIGHCHPHYVERLTRQLQELFGHNFSNDGQSLYPLSVVTPPRQPSWLFGRTSISLNAK